MFLFPADGGVADVAPATTAVAGGAVAAGEGVVALAGVVEVASVCVVVVEALRPPRPPFEPEAILILLRADPWSRLLSSAVRQASYCG